MKIKITGVDNVVEYLEGVCNIDKLEKGIKDSCLLVERSAKQKAPKGNGDLRRSIESKVDGLSGVVFTPLEYAPYIEFGTGLFAEDGKGRKDVPWVYCDEKGEFHTTRGISPHPFMRPALEENRDKIREILRGAILNK